MIDSLVAACTSLIFRDVQPLLAAENANTFRLWRRWFRVSCIRVDDDPDHEARHVGVHRQSPLTASHHPKLYEPDAAVPNGVTHWGPFAGVVVARGREFERGLPQGSGGRAPTGDDVLVQLERTQFRGHRKADGLDVVCVGLDFLGLRCGIDIFKVYLRT